MIEGSYAIVLKPGRCFVGVTRASYTPIDDVPNGYFLVQAETTAAYVMTGGDVITNFAAQGAFVARDESFLIFLGPEDRFSYYLPAGGTIRLVPVELVSLTKSPKTDGQWSSNRPQDHY